MKKKTRQRFLYALWVLVAVAGLALWYVPPRFMPPRAVWRAPVGFQVPSISLPDVSLPEAVGEGVRDAIDGAAEQLTQPEEPVPAPYEETPYEEPRHPKEPAPVVSAPLAAGEHPRIALIIDDMGLVATLSARALRLPAPVTLSYLPYAPDLGAQVAAAKNQGHEIMLHLPMEPLGGARPGPGALMSAMDEDQTRQATLAALDKFDGYVGVNNHMGSKLTLDRNKMEVVAEIMHERGLFFVDSRTSGRSVAYQAMQAAGVRTAARDIFLDDVRTPQAVQGELTRLESVARRRGLAVAIGHPHAVTLSALESWIPAARAKGYQFVPVSEIVR